MRETMRTILARVESSMDKQETWSRPDFEETSSGFEVTAYVNDWDQDRL
jgi:coenzyme PQQ precursor peptide PqqA